jgi:hypothetical protein
MSPALKGVNLDVFAVFAHAMGAASDYGSDPEDDYLEQSSFLIAIKIHDLLKSFNIDLIGFFAIPNLQLIVD